MKVLVCCEMSQAVTSELRKRGHEAYSCDILDVSVPYPQYHIFANCIPLLAGKCYFYTQDECLHYIDEWDAIIGFPPCRYLSDASSHLCKGDSLYAIDRREKREAALTFFKRIYNSCCPIKIVENSYSSFLFDNIGIPSCIVQPYFFGDYFEKKTCLWFSPGMMLPYALPPDNKCFPSWVHIPHYDKFGNLLKIGSDELRQVRALTFPGVASFLCDVVEYNFHFLKKN